MTHRNATTGEAATPHGAATAAPLVIDRQNRLNFTQKCSTGLWLRSPTGCMFELGCGRGSCPKCGKKRRDELARVLLADSTVEQPTHAVTLTTARPGTTSAEMVRAQRMLIQDVRRKYGPVRFVSKPEWTTGQGAKSGGHRRFHLHQAWKDLEVPAGGVAEVEDLVRHHMRRLLGAPIVEVATLRSIGGAMAYMTAIHHDKSAQQAPSGWRGMGVRWSQGQHRYTHRPVAELRADAKEALTRERVAWRARQEHPGATDDDVSALVELDAAERALRREVGGWELLRGSFSIGGLWRPLGAATSR